MASSSQRRCVFVGNIPYDATEEQLIEICREVGPVVSFRLVIDRETGKPKGYGFCEYKDEETALSARRNLQGYEINGRQLRVDFAENDKGADRNREQGHGGPGLAVNAEPQKQIGGPAVHGESANNQPIGLHLAITAASVMAGALGGPQIGLQSTQNTPLAPASDPLALHLAKMSRNQLNEIISSLKVMATQNKEQAQELLLSRPQLLKAVFQAQIMLGMVTPQALQMPNILQPPGQSTLSSSLEAQQSTQAVTQNHPGLPPLAQKTQPQTRLPHNQFSVTQQAATQPFLQNPQHGNMKVLQQPTMPGLSGVSTLPSVRPPNVRPQIQVPTSLNQPSLVQRRGQVAGPSSLGYGSQVALPNNAIQSSLPRPPLPDAGSQHGQAILSGFADRINKIRDSVDPINRPSKMIKTDDGRSISFLGSGPSRAHGSGPMLVNPVSRTEQVQHPEKQVSQTQLPPDVQSALLQQVLSLTPEQLNSLTPEQRQQVLQLQQELRRDQVQPS